MKKTVFLLNRRLINLLIISSAAASHLIWTIILSGIHTAFQTSNAVAMPILTGVLVARVTNRWIWFVIPTCAFLGLENFAVYKFHFPNDPVAPGLMFGTTIIQMALASTAILLTRRIGCFARRRMES